MGDNEQDRRTTRTHGAFQSGSFLLRVWTEGREIEGQTPETRVFVRNLKTGTEQYLGDVDQPLAVAAVHVLEEPPEAVARTSASPGPGSWRRTPTSSPRDRTASGRDR